MIVKELLLFSVVFITLFVHINGRSIGIRSDVVETKYVPDSPKDTKPKSVYDETSSSSIDNNPKKPGWMKSQLLRFGDITSRVGNSLGGGAMKVAAIVEKLCKLLKTVIPIVAAVCNVGQFQFCMAVDAPTQLSEAMSQPMGTMDLNAPDK